MQELDEYIDRIKHLPPAPKILPRLLLLLGKPDIDSSQVVDLITFDPALTASVLQLCNSAFFASATPAADLQEAITRLGFRQVYQLVAAISGARLLSSPQKGYGIDVGELWRHSVSTAITAQLIARQADEDVNVVFTAGLLHDLGKIILSEALEHIYAKLVEETEKNQSSLQEAEKRLLGVEHAEIGGRLLARWNFPPNLVSAVWNHHQPGAARGFERLASAIYLGDMISHFMGHGYGYQAFALRGRAEALEILRLNPDQLPRFMIETYDKLEAIEALLRQGGAPNNA
jgi:putative nucleotidyltransferase with HDIG domain